MSSVVHLHYSLRKNIGTHAVACFEQDSFLVNPTGYFRLKNIYLSKIDLLCEVTGDILHFSGYLAKHNDFYFTLNIPDTLSKDG